MKGVFVLDCYCNINPYNGIDINQRKNTAVNYCGSALAIPSVPMQEWRNIYSAEIALSRGTMFEELDLPFYGGDNL